MDKAKAYDLPTRIFHWLFAALFLFAFGVATWIDDDSSLYIYHMLAGFSLMYLVLLRIVWGFIGSKHARFSSFKLAPSGLLQYFRSIISAKSKRYMGHNPASSYAALAMFGFTFGLAITGLLMSNGIGEDFFEEIHELCSTGFMITAVLHVAGVVLHHTKHKDGLLVSMLNGKIEPIEGESGITSNRPIVALVFVGLILSFGICLNQNYDSTTQNLNFLGVQIDLGDSEHSYDEGDEGEHDDEHDD